MRTTTQAYVRWLSSTGFHLVLLSILTCLPSAIAAKEPFEFPAKQGLLISGEIYGRQKTVSIDRKIEPASSQNLWDRLIKFGTLEYMGTTDEFKFGISSPHYILVKSADEKSSALFIEGYVTVDSRKLFKMKDKKMFGLIAREILRLE